MDTKNENRIYSIHDIVEVSEDGGKSFRTMLPYSGIHPDHHAWFIHPDNPDFILEGNDGGIGISRDRGNTRTFRGETMYQNIRQILVEYNPACICVLYKHKLLNTYYYWLPQQ